jgi:hypothetical protein
VPSACPNGRTITVTQRRSCATRGPPDLRSRVKPQVTNSPEGALTRRRSQVRGLQRPRKPADQGVTVADRPGRTSRNKAVSESAPNSSVRRWLALDGHLAEVETQQGQGCGRGSTARASPLRGSHPSPYRSLPQTLSIRIRDGPTRVAVARQCCHSRGPIPAPILVGSTNKKASSPSGAAPPSVEAHDRCRFVSDRDTEALEISRLDG